MTGFRNLCLAWFFLLSTATVYATDPNLPWKTLESENFRVHFVDGQQDLSKKVINISESIYPRLTNLFNWTPKDKTEIVLTDSYDFANGWASLFPFNLINLRIVPPLEGSLIEFDDWLHLLITHELAHIVHLDKGEGIMPFGRSVVGRFPLLFPNIFQQRWFKEGVATWVETDEEQKIGRGQAEYYRMMMRTEVMYGLRPLSQVNLDSREWPFNSAYLYGVYFFNFLESQYGRDSIIKLIEHYSDNLVPYLVVSNPSNVFDKNLDELWDEFEGWLQNEFKQEIEELKSNPQSQIKLVTKQGLGSGQAEIVGNRVWYVDQSPFTKPILYRAEGQGSLAETKLESGARLAVKDSQTVIINQPEFCDEYNNFYKLYQLKGGELLPLSEECERYQYIEWNHDGNQLAGVRYENGYGELNLFSLESIDQPITLSIPKNWTIGRISWLADDSGIVAAVKRPAKTWDIGVIKLSDQSWTWLIADDSESIDPFVWQDQLFYSRGENGFYDIAQKSLINSDHKIVTHLASGGFRPAYSESLGLMFDYYGKQGFNLARLPQEKFANKPVAGKFSSRPVQVAAEVKDTEEYNYNAVSSLTPTWWLPHYVTDAKLIEAGVSFTGEDALGNHSYNALIAYENFTEEVTGNLTYLYDGRWLFNFSKSMDLIENVSGNLVEIEREIFNQQLFWVQPFLSTAGNHFVAIGAGLQQDEFTDNTKTFRPFILDDNVVGIGWRFDNSNYFTLSHGEAEGRKISIQYETSDLIAGDTKGNVSTFEWREYSPLSWIEGHQLAARGLLAVGSEGTSNFRLGGVTSDAIAGASFQFQRREYPLRGYDNQFRGNSVALASIEWRTPLTTIERGWMWIPIGSQNIYLQAFVDSGTAWNKEDSIDQFYTGTGLELVNDISLGYSYRIRTRIGAAQGLNDSGDTQVYFSIGGSF